MARSASEERSVGLPSSIARLQALYDMGQAVGRARALGDAYESAIDGLLAVLGADRASILRFDDAGAMRFVAWRGISDGYRAAVDGHTPWGPDDVDARPIAVPDVAADDSLAGVREVILQEGIQACAFVPLLHGGRLVGKFMLYYDEPHEFSDDELRLAETVAAQIAAASERVAAEGALRASRDQLELILSNIGDGITMQDAEGRVLYANEAAAELIGLPVEEILDAPPASLPARYELIDEHGEPLSVEQLPSRRAARANEIVGPMVVGFRRPGPSTPPRWSMVTSVPIVGANGELERTITVFRDVTARRAAGLRRQLLSEAGRLLGSSLEPEETLQAVTEVVIPAAADVCIVHLIEEGGRLRRVAAAAVDEELARRAAEFEDRWPQQPDGPGVPYVARSGKSLFVPDLDAVLPTVATGLREQGEFVRSLGVRGFAIVPLVAHGRTLGALTLVAAGDSDRVLDVEDLALAEELGRRAGVALENSRLLAAERAARRLLERLGRVTEVALAHLVLRDLLPPLLGQIVEVLDADTGAILLREGNLLRLGATVGLGEELEHAVPIPIGRGLAGSVAATRRPVVVDRLDEVELVSPVLRERGVQSLVATPLIALGEVIGVMHVGSERPARFDEEDARLLQLVADRIALAINQSRLYEAEREARRRFRFLSEASELLGASLDYATTLRRLAELAVPQFADWCSIDMVEEGELRHIALVHADPERAALAERVRQRFPSREWASEGRRGVWHVIRTGAPELVPEIHEEMFRDPDNPELEAVVRQLGLRSAMIVPLTARGRTFGAISLVSAESGREYGDTDLELAVELARRAAVAVDNARLYREAEERGQAARALAAVGDGVFLVDRHDVVRSWNQAAAAITGLPASQVVGRRAAEAIPGWVDLGPRVPVAHGPRTAAAETVPFTVDGRELWLSISGVGFEDGIVYAFRDLTEERVLEVMRSEFVSTVSHELRTPLAAIYGAAMTLQRPDMRLGEVQRESLLGVIANEADRLARTVNDILWASRIDTDQVRVAIESCDPAELAEAVVRAQHAHLPEAVELELSIPEFLPSVAADPDKVRQVLGNLVENAVKYSPDGGRIEVKLVSTGSTVRFSVSDEGLGIPGPEQRRIFEKFYRLDPQMTRGVGGTGLGLYICQELVRRMGGRIWVESDRPRGSTFHVELPVAGTEADFRAHLGRE